MHFALFAALLLMVQCVGAGGDPPPYLLVAQYGDISKFYLDSLQFETFIHEPLGGIQAVEYHYWMNTVFWSNTETRSIHRANLDNGSFVEMVIDSGMLYPVSLSVDWITNKLYWSDRDMSMIEVYDICEQKRQIMIDTLGLPLGIAIDPFAGFMYWTNRLNHMIERANLSSMRTTREMMTDKLMCPSPLTIDYDARVLYWTDYCWYRIECMALDGGEYHMIQDANIFFSGAMTLFNNTLYWIQHVPVGIFATSKTGGEEARMVYAGSSTQPFRDIKVVHPSRQYIHPDALDCKYFHNCTTPTPSPTPSPSSHSVTPSLMLLPSVVNVSIHLTTTAEQFTGRQSPYPTTWAFTTTSSPLSTLLETTPTPSSLSAYLHIPPTTTFVAAPQPSSSIQSPHLSTPTPAHVVSTPMKSVPTSTNVLYSTTSMWSPHLDLTTITSPTLTSWAATLALTSSSVPAYSTAAYTTPTKLSTSIQLPHISTLDLSTTASPTLTSWAATLELTSSSVAAYSTAAMTSHTELSPSTQLPHISTPSHQTVTSAVMTISVSAPRISPSPNISTLSKVFDTSVSTRFTTPTSLKILLVSTRMPTSAVVLSTPRPSCSLDCYATSIETSPVVVATSSTAKFTVVLPEVSCGSEAASCVLLSPSAVTLSSFIVSSSVVSYGQPIASIMDASVMMMICGGVVVGIILIIVGIVVCGISIIYVKRRETKVIKEASEAGSSSWRRKNSNHYQSARHREAMFKNNDYILRTLDITDLPLRTSSPMDDDDVPVAKKRVSFDDRILYSDASFSSHPESDSENEANGPPLHPNPECTYYRDGEDIIFNNETEVIGEC